MPDCYGMGHRRPASFKWIRSACCNVVSCTINAGGIFMAQSTRLTSAVAAIGAVALLSGCGGEAATLDGTYYPQFAPDANRLDRALTDHSWTFSADGTVVTNSESGARQWTYKVSGQKVHLSGASDRNAGERRVLTIGDDGCIWDGSGNLAGKISFCA